MRGTMKTHKNLFRQLLDNSTKHYSINSSPSRSESTGDSSEFSDNIADSDNSKSNPQKFNK